MIPKYAQEQTERVRFEGDIGVHEERAIGPRATRRSRFQAIGFPARWLEMTTTVTGPNGAAGLSWLPCSTSGAWSEAAKARTSASGSPGFGPFQADGDLERPSSRPATRPPAPQRETRVHDRARARPPARTARVTSPAASVIRSRGRIEARQARRTRP